MSSSRTRAASESADEALGSSMNFPSKKILTIGRIMQAVPVPNISWSLPSLEAVITSSSVTSYSETLGEPVK